MQLEDYFVFLAPNDIRVRGTRIGIETILNDFLEKKRTPEEIYQSYHTLELEQVYATILYYLHDQEKVADYLNKWREYTRKMQEEQRRNPPQVAAKLRKFKSKQYSLNSDKTK
ncbi:MAG: DUF433 domain-containing protein [Kamptonema sp. SIO1D9]|nr:DUF433 domain-containing protein [Kamptonema sp. SIO1D9]